MRGQVERDVLVELNSVDLMDLLRQGVVSCLDPNHPRGHGVPVDVYSVACGDATRVGDALRELLGLLAHVRGPAMTSSSWGVLTSAVLRVGDRVLVVGDERVTEGEVTRILDISACGPVHVRPDHGQEPSVVVFHPNIRLLSSTD
jgi:hypothetical protein